MDLENDFFLVRFQDENDYNKALVGGPWVIFGRYLTVRPWSPDFSIAQSGIESQIGQTVGLVVKLDVHMDCAHRGRFAQLAVYVYLRKPLVSKTTSLVGESNCARLVMDKSGLERRVEDEPLGPYMVVE
ncbi:hypothetical protein Gohar_021748 [Gossypium harknessii]|uniref:DUF4283 domain-containing protein n=1 Tax=Gossypium harknessii TaxID=34285 RepID=A0A7J9I6A4_9ROSI|nr:hypothetical protein [Gossypium harknessii]